ncbi:MAG: UvrD-helicase domain-containing protein [Spirochaetaceae bacterium]|jgi:ATP-dependent helicase/nuclease subunit A|nr:UvrD-helicase domain-containing protein [Spirochaetaceae bacterium]
MALNDILAALNGEQRDAARAGQNAVIAAGAGSGKTRVLAARYAWLVMEKGYRPEEILALTFTNKAANEMHSRIYTLLSGEKDNQNAREAVENFYKARISTIDSFCASVARLAARHYGIRSDFASDDGAAGELAMSLALPFVLDHRDNPALQVLIADRKIKTVAEELFAQTMLDYSPITSPLDIASFFKIQKEEILSQWLKKTNDVSALLDGMARDLEAAPKANKFFSACAGLLAKIPPPPGIAILLENPEGFQGSPGREELCAYVNALYNLGQVNRQGASAWPAASQCVLDLRENLCPSLQALANYVLQAGIAASLFPLMDEFQTLHNRRKREAGILTFSDIARMAVDALRDYPEIRKIYKDEIRAVMIDEFQDNNSLQRDLLFLLSEKPDRNSRGIPGAGGLCPDRMFFVGDEKQSIYRFRGADVSVFRGLTKTLPPSEGESMRYLRYNYRSNGALIAAFNLVFGGIDPGDPGSRPGSFPAVFLPKDSSDDDFESYYLPAEAPPETPHGAGQESGDPSRAKPPALHFSFLDEGRIDIKDSDSLSASDLEAAAIAETIRDMVDRGRPVAVRGRVESRPVRWDDFAVLQRSRGKQHRLEKQFQDFGIPFSADQPAGLFSEAPINDMHNYLRLLVYPQDRLAYAALLRSPFMRLSDEVLAAVLLSGQTLPFDSDLDDKIPPSELEQYRECGRRYRAMAEAAKILPVNVLVGRLWYDEGYRYETLWSPSSQIYGELFDYYFKLACDSDRQGKTLAGFIDYIEDLISKEEKPNDLSLAAEQGRGVRILTIHKSKGLEFPIVFLYNCASNSRKETNSGALCFSEKWGPCINFPQAEGLPPGAAGNIFFELRKTEESKKESAELRRLLYVAMTRAESALYLTATLPPRTKKEEETEGAQDSVAYNKKAIMARLSGLMTKRAGRTDNFLDLLLPPLVSGSAGEGRVFTVNVIPVRTRTELLAEARKRSKTGPLLSMVLAAEKAAPLYESAPQETAEPHIPGRIQASSLRVPIPPPEENGQDATWDETQDSTQDKDDLEIDRLLENAKIDAAGFGTIAHAFLEARLDGTSPAIPPDIASRLSDKENAAIQAAATLMADRFMTSNLGRLATDASFRKTEFPFLTRTRTKPTLIISGKIDMLFESDGTIHVVDFKTDKKENPPDHYGQLAVYTRAASDIFGQPVRTWLYYLRRGHSMELTSAVKTIDIETLAETHISHPIHNPPV